MKCWMKLLCVYDLAKKSKEHMNSLKRNFWLLICSRVGISITEAESTMREDDLWKMCYTRLMETKDNFCVQSNVGFIFENYQIKISTRN